MSLPNGISLRPTTLAGCTSMTDIQTYRRTTLWDHLDGLDPCPTLMQLSDTIRKKTHLEWTDCKARFVTFLTDEKLSCYSHKTPWYA